MTVDELLAKLGAAFAAFNARALEAWAPVYRARLGKHEGPALAKAYAETLGGFTVKGSKSLFPMPADFEAYLPSGRIDLGKDEGPVVDFEGRARRAHAMYDEWLHEQAPRAAYNRPEIMKALETIAWPMALVRGWNEKADRLLLSRAQVAVALQRAISQERYTRYGKPGRDPHTWWAQIKGIAEEWRIDITPEWWGKETAETLAKPRDIAA